MSETTYNEKLVGLQLHFDEKTIYVSKGLQAGKGWINDVIKERARRDGMDAYAYALNSLELSVPQTLSDFVHEQVRRKEQEDLKMAMDYGVRVDYSSMFGGIRFLEPELRMPKIKQVHFSNPVTVVIWEDKTKTIVRCENETYDPEKGLAVAIAKRALGNKGHYYDEFKKWLPVEEVDEKTTEPSFNEEENTYFDIKCASERFNIPANELRKGIKNGDYPGAEKICGRWHIPLSELRAKEE